MRKIKFAPGEHYHIYNRGNHKQPVFLKDEDRWRFLFLILYLQSLAYFPNIHRLIDYFVQHRVLNKQEDITTNRYVELVSFVLMPNHFHLIVYELREGGISQYLQRFLNAYTKYFNTKYEKSGHLFQGPFQAVHINDNEQLLYLSAYIHRNPRELKEWQDREHEFYWSSYQDYTIKNRWGDALRRNVIIDQFPDGRAYKLFVEKSGAKEKEILDEKLFID